MRNKAWFLNYLFISAPGSNPGSHVAFSYHHSLDPINSLNLEKYFIFCLSRPWNFLIAQAVYFYGLSINLGYVNVFHNLFRVYVFHNFKKEKQLSKKQNEHRNSTLQALVSNEIGITRRFMKIFIDIFF